MIFLSLIILSYPTKPPVLFWEHLQFLKPKRIKFIIITKRIYAVAFKKIKKCEPYKCSAICYVNYCRYHHTSRRWSNRGPSIGRGTNQTKILVEMEIYSLWESIEKLTIFDNIKLCI